VRNNLPWFDLFTRKGYRINSMKTEKLIPWARPWINDDDIRLVSGALESGWISGGKQIVQFEESLTKIFDSKTFIACANGTAALHLALLSLDLTYGDEVIVPGYGFMGAANVALLMGLKVRFADVRTDDFSMESTSAEALINGKTKAIILIHNYGYVGECKEISDLCKRFNLFLIEDCAEALFSGKNGYHAGNYADLATYSFHATKTITTGEGGAVCTDNPKLIERIRLLRSHGMERKIPYQHELAGLNYRLTNFQAALGLAQLARHQEIMSRILNAHSRYIKNLSSASANLISAREFDKKFFPWSYPIFVNKLNLDIQNLREQLLLHGIETRPGFISPNKLGYLKTTDPIKNSVTLSDNLLNLPLYSTITNDDIDYVSEILIDLVTQADNV
jgi:perosamine synthetase